jgi:hypothetical protein
MDFPMLSAKKPTGSQDETEESSYLATDESEDGLSVGDEGLQLGDNGAQPENKAMLEQLRFAVNKPAGPGKVVKPRAQLNSQSLLTEPTGLAKLRSLKVPSAPTNFDDQDCVLKAVGKLLFLYRQWATGHFPKLDLKSFLQRLDKRVVLEPTMREYLRAFADRAQANDLANFTEQGFLADLLWAQANQPSASTEEQRMDK